MPKRNAKEKLERYRSKIRRLEKKLQRKGDDVDALVDSEEEQDPPNQQLYDRDPELSSDEPNQNLVPDQRPLQDAAQDPLPAPDPRPMSDTLPAPDPLPVPDAHLEPDPVDAPLDPQILAALGEPTEETSEFGKKIHENLAALWAPILKKGLSKETKDKIIKQYMVPENCKLLQAPKLNAEIAAAVSDMVRNRDKKLGTFQQQLGYGITAVNRAMDELLVRPDNVNDILKSLSDGCRILSDLHSLCSQDRTRLITPSLDKAFMTIIQDSQRDESLFGSSLSEKIKASKAIEKQGLQIKKAAAPKAVASSSQATAPRPHQGNWSGPPRYPPSNRGGRGGYRRPPPPPVVNRRPPQSQAHTQPRGVNQSKPRAPTHH